MAGLTAGDPDARPVARRLRARLCGACPTSSGTPSRGAGDRRPPTPPARRGPSRSASAGPARSSWRSSPTAARGGDRRDRLPRHRAAAPPRLYRVLRLAARGRADPCPGPSRHPRHARMAARQGRGAVRSLRARGGARRRAGDLSLHRQQPRRGRPGQAPHRGRHGRAPDAAARRRRDARRCGRARSAVRRICRGAGPRPAPRAAARRRDPRPGARRPASLADCGIAAGDAQRRGPGAPRRLALRPQGGAHRRRPACVRGRHGCAGAATSRPAARPRRRASWRRSTGASCGRGPPARPARGRLDVLPTGRNLYAVDPRAVPTRTACRDRRPRRRRGGKPLRPGPRRLAAPPRHRPVGQRHHAHRAATTSRRPSR